MIFAPESETIWDGKTLSQDTRKPTLHHSENLL